MQAALAQPSPLAAASLHDPGPVQVPPGNFTKAAFEKMVEDSKEFIRAGDIFQIVLSQRFSREFTKTPLDLYRALWALDSLTGQTTSDDILNLIFSTFCIGK